MSITGVRIIPSPLGKILLASGDGRSVCGLWFLGQRYFSRGMEETADTVDLPVFAGTEEWLKQYFRGIDPGPVPELDPRGTPFQLEVWAAMREIPYGKTCGYGELAAILSQRQGNRRVSPRAVGSAVARNPISILQPCHRVLAADGSLHGYAGGIWRKAALLAMEQGIPFQN